MRRLAFVALFLALSATPALADTPTERVREFFGSINRIIADPGYDDRPQDRLAALRRLVVEIVDFRNAAALALGNEWSARTPADREEFTRLFTDLLQTSVFASVGARARVDNGLVVTYIAELSDRDGATVSTSVLTRSGGEMAVGYRMLSRDGRWVVYDVVVDGVSLIENYRAQFQKVIHRSSYASLVNEMKGRISDLGRSATVAAEPPKSQPVATLATTITVPVAPAPVAEPTPVVIAAAVPREVPLVEPRAEEPARAAPRITASLTPPPTPVVPAIKPRATVQSTPGAPEYWVQLGAFSSSTLAMKLATALHDQAVSLITLPRNPLMFVRVGPFSSRGAASTKLRELRGMGHDGFVASESGR